MYDVNVHRATNPSNDTALYCILIFSTRQLIRCYLHLLLLLSMRRTQRIHPRLIKGI